MLPPDFDSDSMADPYDWDALARYVAGESTPAERHDVEAWLSARPEREQLVSALRESIAALAVSTVDDSDIDVEAALRKVHTRMKRPVVVLARWRPVAALAAAAAVLVVAIGVWNRRQPTPAAPVAMATSYATAIGQRDLV